MTQIKIYSNWTLKVIDVDGTSKEYEFLAKDSGSAFAFVLDMVKDMYEYGIIFEYADAMCINVYPKMPKEASLVTFIINPINR